MDANFGVGILANTIGIGLGDVIGNRVALPVIVSLPGQGPAGDDIAVVAEVELTDATVAAFELAFS